jgi:hypothetical protein
LLLLLQAPPPTQENGEGVPIDIEGTVEQGVKASNKAMKQQPGEGGGMYLKNKKVNNKA